MDWSVDLLRSFTLAFWEHSIFIQVPETAKVNIYFLPQNCWESRKYYPAYIDKSGKGKDCNSQRSRIRRSTPEQWSISVCPASRAWHPNKSWPGNTNFTLYPRALWDTAFFGHSLENSDAHSFPFPLIWDEHFRCAHMKGFIHKLPFLIFQFSSSHCFSWSSTASQI